MLKNEEAAGSAEPASAVASSSTTCGRKSDTRCPGGGGARRHRRRAFPRRRLKGARGSEETRVVAGQSSAALAGHGREEQTVDEDAARTGKRRAEQAVRRARRRSGAGSGAARGKRARVALELADRPKSCSWRKARRCHLHGTHVPIWSGHADAAHPSQCVVRNGRAGYPGSRNSYGTRVYGGFGLRSQNLRFYVTARATALSTMGIGSGGDGNHGGKGRLASSAKRGGAKVGGMGRGSGCYLTTKCTEYIRRHADPFGR